MKQANNKHYEIVVHRVNGKYYNEVYCRNKDNTLSYVDEFEADRIPNDYPFKEIYELSHPDNYEKVKSPFNGKMLYGRYINISTRIKDEINRF